MTYKQQLQKIQAIEQLIASTKLELKSWANQISKYHKALKELTSQVEAIKTKLTMNQPKTKPTKSIK